MSVTAPRKVAFPFQPSKPSFYWGRRKTFNTWASLCNLLGMHCDPT